MRTYKLPFWKWFNEKYPCSTNHTDENPKYRIGYIRNETEIYQYSKKVSTQGLIGQVGGIHGITLGWSI